MDLIPISAISSGVNISYRFMGYSHFYFWDLYIQKWKNKEITAVEGRMKEEKGWKDGSEVKQKHF